MRKVVVALLATMSLASCEQKNEEVKHQVKEPGFYEQYQMMKANEQGEIPSGLWRKWDKQSNRLDKSDFFKSVKEMGPSNVGGRVRGLIIDLDNPSRLLAAGVSGGVWESVNSGQNWAPINDYQATLSVSSISQNPFRTNEIVYSTGEASGNSAGIPGNGIFKSTDGGKSFSFLEASDIPSFDYTWEIVHSKVYDSVIYVATRDNGLYRSEDAGNSFEQIYKNGSRGVNDILVRTSDSTVIFSVPGRGIFQFKEGEENPSPEQLTEGLPSSGYGRVLVDHSENNQNVVYAAFATPSGDDLFGVYKSTDAGKTWQTKANASLTGISYNYAWYCFLLAVHPDDPDFVVLSAQKGGFSNNGGDSWQALREGHVDYHVARFVPNSNTFFIGNDGGIYRYSTTSARTSVSDRNSNFNVTQWYAGDYFPVSEGDQVIAGAQDNNTRINNAGLAYTEVLGGDGSYCQISEDGNLFYASYQNGQIRRSNGGSWANIYWGLASVAGTQDFHFINPFGINDVDANQVYFPTKNYLVRSADAGSTWELATSALPGNMYCVGITPEDNPTVYIGGASTIFHRVDNALDAEPGDHFFFTPAKRPSNAVGFIGCIEIDPTEPSTIYLAMTNVSTLPRIWKIDDADTENAVWKDISGNLPEELPVNWIEVDPNNSEYIMIGTDYGLYTSTNGGTTWGKDATIPNVPVYMVRFRPEDRKLFVFTHGRGTWVAELEEDIASVADNGVLPKANAWPNPAQNILHLNVEFSQAEVQVYDASGKAFSVAQVSKKGLDVSKLQSGVYYGSIESEGKTYSLKFLKQ
jgi:photosystem II stability/assembly factor-like uncharacterized protein